MLPVEESVPGFMAGGVIGAAVSMFTKESSKFKDTAKKTKSDDEAIAAGMIGGFSVFFIILVIVFAILSLVFLVAIYKMVPSYKVLHTIMSFLLGALWYMPVLIHYCVTNDYTLSLSSGMAANNNRARNSRYL